MPPVVDMVKSKAIVRLTSEQLSKLLGAHGVTARKNSTKTFKTRQIMQLPLVSQHCSQEELTALDDLLKQIDAKRRKQPKEEQEGDEDGDEAPVCDIVWCSEKQKVLVLKFKQWLRCGMQQGTRPPILLWSTQNRCLERCRTRRRGIRICRRLVQTQLLTTNNKHQINLAPMHTKPLSCGFLQTQDEGDGATDDANAVEPGPGPNGAGNDEQAEQGVLPEQPPAERLRESRHALSSCSPVPQWLQERFAMPAECTIVHVVHTSKMLPHFQVRLGSGQVFQGKMLGRIMIHTLLFIIQHPALSRAFSRTVVIRKTLGVLSAAQGFDFCELQPGCTCRQLG